MRAAEGSGHPGLSIPVSRRHSALEWLTQLIDAAQEDRLPGIPREQAADEAPTRADHLDGNQQEGLEKRLKLHAEYRASSGDIMER